MTEKLLPPFKVQQTDEAAWVEDRLGRRFGYVYWRDKPIIGTDRSDRLPRGLAIRTVNWIRKAAEEAARAGP